ERAADVRATRLSAHDHLRAADRDRALPALPATLRPGDQLHDRRRDHRLPAQIPARRAQSDELRDGAESAADPALPVQLAADLDDGDDRAVGHGESGRLRLRHPPLPGARTDLRPLPLHADDPLGGDADPELPDDPGVGLDRQLLRSDRAVRRDRLRHLHAAPILPDDTAGVARRGDDRRLRQPALPRPNRPAALAPRPRDAGDLRVPADLEPIPLAIVSHQSEGDAHDPDRAELSAQRRDDLVQQHDGGGHPRDHPDDGVADCRPASTGTRPHRGRGEGL
ncbi:MAG: N-acetyl-D-glucosamine ABC transporter, permease protein 2, partial [uncultured Thermomicrobiales bacterium]